MSHAPQPRQSPEEQKTNVLEKWFNSHTSVMKKFTRAPNNGKSRKTQRQAWDGLDGDDDAFTAVTVTHPSTSFDGERQQYVRRCCAGSNADRANSKSLSKRHASRPIPSLPPLAPCPTPPVSPACFRCAFVPFTQNTIPFSKHHLTCHRHASPSILSPRPRTRNPSPQPMSRHYLGNTTF